MVGQQALMEGTGPGSKSALSAADSARPFSAPFSSRFKHHKSRIQTEVGLGADENS